MSQFRPINQSQSRLNDQLYTSNADIQQQSKHGLVSNANNQLKHSPYTFGTVDPYQSNIQNQSNQQQQQLSKFGSFQIGQTNPIDQSQVNLQRKQSVSSQINRQQYTNSNQQQQNYQTSHLNTFSINNQNSNQQQYNLNTSNHGYQQNMNSSNTVQQQQQPFNDEINQSQKQNYDNMSQQFNSVQISKYQSKDQSRHQTQRRHYIYTEESSCLQDMLVYFQQRVSRQFYLALLVLIVYMILDLALLGTILRNMSNQVMIKIQSSNKGFFYYFYTLMSAVGKQGMVAILAICLYCFPNNQTKLWTMLSYVSINFGISNILKYLYSESRPYYDTDIYPRECDFGFGKPSGHSYLSTLILFIVYYEYIYKSNENYFEEVIEPLQSKQSKQQSNNHSHYSHHSYQSYQQQSNRTSGEHNCLVFVILVILDASICISRIYLGVHDLSQVVLGVVMAVCILSMYFWGFRSLIYESIEYLDRLRYYCYYSEEQELKNIRTRLIIKYFLIVLLICLTMTLMFMFTNIDSFSFDLNRIQAKCYDKIVDQYQLKLNGFYVKAYIYTSFFNVFPIVMIGVILRSWISDYLVTKHPQIADNYPKYKNVFKMIIMLTLVIILAFIPLLVLGIPLHILYATRLMKLTAICKFVYYGLMFMAVLLAYFTWFQILVQGEFRDELYSSMFSGGCIKYLQSKLNNMKMKVSDEMHFSYEHDNQVNQDVVSYGSMSDNNDDVHDYQQNEQNCSDIANIKRSNMFMSSGNKQQQQQQQQMNNE